MGICGSRCLGKNETECGERCVNTQTNADHCGICGNSCASDHKCTSGKCIPLLPCEGSNDPCDAHGSCGFSGTEFECECQNGFVHPAPSDLSCIDVDECTSNTHDCDPLADCENSSGSFSCLCPSGYDNEPTSPSDCVDVDECTSNTHDCDPLADCENSIGSFSCLCPSGYDNDPITPSDCIDVDECTKELDNCDPVADCENSDGGFSCACPPGYWGDGTSCSCDFDNFTLSCNGTVASADSTFPGYSASNVIDGDTTTEQSSTESWANHWPVVLPQNFFITFSSSQTFGRIELFTSDGYPIEDYAIDYFDGSSWIELVNIADNLVVHRTHTFSQVTSAPIRIRCIRGPSVQYIYNRLNEVQVFAN